MSNTGAIPRRLYGGHRAARKLISPRLLPWTGIPFFLCVCYALPLASEVPVPEAVLRTQRIQRVVDQLRTRLSITNEVQAGLVTGNERLFSVQHSPEADGVYLLSVNPTFLDLLDEEELRAAVAHELGHVWIFTHFPYLQTERLANDIGRRAVSRESLERVYTKLWRHQGTTGNFDELLGPADSHSD